MGKVGIRVVKEGPNHMINENIRVKSTSTSTNGDSIKNEASGKDAQFEKVLEAISPPKLGWFARQSETVQVVIATAGAAAGFVLLCFAGGAASTVIKEAANRKTLNSEGYKAHDKLLSDEAMARISRGLYDEPKTLEEAAARMLQKSQEQRVIIYDPYAGSTEV